MSGYIVNKISINDSVKLYQTKFNKNIVDARLVLVDSNTIKGQETNLFTKCPERLRKGILSKEDPREDNQILGIRIHTKAQHILFSFIKTITFGLINKSFSVRFKGKVIYLNTGSFLKWKASHPEMKSILKLSPCPKNLRNRYSREIHLIEKFLGLPLAERPAIKRPLPLAQDGFEAAEIAFKYANKKLAEREWKGVSPEALQLIKNRLAAFYILKHAKRGMECTGDKYLEISPQVKVFDQYRKMDNIKALCSKDATTLTNEERHILDHAEILTDEDGKERVIYKLPDLFTSALEGNRPVELKKTLVRGFQHDPNYLEKVENILLKHKSGSKSEEALIGEFNALGKALYTQFGDTNPELYLQEVVKDSFLEWTGELRKAGIINSKDDLLDAMDSGPSLQFFLEAAWRLVFTARLENGKIVCQKGEKQIVFDAEQVVMKQGNANVMLNHVGPLSGKLEGERHQNYDKRLWAQFIGSSTETKQWVRKAVVEIMKDLQDLEGIASAIETRVGELPEGERKEKQALLNLIHRVAAVLKTRYEQRFLGSLIDEVQFDSAPLKYNAGAPAVTTPVTPSADTDSDEEEEEPDPDHPDFIKALDWAMNTLTLEGDEATARALEALKTGEWQLTDGNPVPVPMPGVPVGEAALPPGYEDAFVEGLCQGLSEVKAHEYAKNKTKVRVTPAPAPTPSPVQVPVPTPALRSEYEPADGTETEVYELTLANNDTPPNVYRRSKARHDAMINTYLKPYFDEAHVSLPTRGDLPAFPPDESKNAKRNLGGNLVDQTVKKLFWIPHSNGNNTISGSCGVGALAQAVFGLYVDGECEGEDYSRSQDAIMAIRKAVAKYMKENAANFPISKQDVLKEAEEFSSHGYLDYYSTLVFALIIGRPIYVLTYGAGREAPTLDANGSIEMRKYCDFFKAEPLYLRLEGTHYDHMRPKRVGTQVIS